MLFRRFEGIRIIGIDVGEFRKGAAVALPGIGIITGKARLSNIGLLRHEFGHFLQFRKFGFFFYWTSVARVSLASAIKARKNRRHQHMYCWTEWSANLLSYRHFGNPADWDMVNYPIAPPQIEGNQNQFNKWINSKIGKLL